MHDRLTGKSTDRVLLVGWAGADWELVHPLLDAGQLPHLEGLVDHGVVGRMATLQPQVAPLVWNSIATGVRPDRHGVVGYLRNTPGGLEPANGRHRNGTPFWETCSGAGLRTHVVNWPTYPAEPITGTFVSEPFTRFGDRPDSEYRALSRALYPPGAAPALEQFRIDPRDLSHEELTPFVPLAAGVDQTLDPALAILANRLAEAASAHAMATAVLEDDWRIAAVCYDLLDRLGHSFMHFHPPRVSASSRSFELYRGVMDQAYRFCDLMLGRLLELAGPESTVILFSDHGFRSGSDRPKRPSTGRGDANWHKQMGILAMRGPAFHEDRWIWGGSLLDLCPTLLTLLGLPVDELDGRPLKDAFKAWPVARSPATTLPRQPTAAAPLERRESEVLGQLLLDDGYLQDVHFSSPQAATMADDACDFNLAQSYLQVGQVEQALELFEQCRERRPEVPRFAIAAARCHVALGQTETARRLVEQALKQGVPQWHGAKLLGQILVAEGKPEEALEQFFLSDAQRPRQPGLHVQIGEAYLSLGRNGEARRAFYKELDQDEDNPQSHQRLGKIALADGDPETALEHLLKSAALQEVNPETHYYLAQALLASGREQDAFRAVERALRQNPSMAEAVALREKLTREN